MDRQTDHIIALCPPTIEQGIIKWQSTLFSVSGQVSRQNVRAVERQCTGEVYEESKTVSSASAAIYAL